MEVTFLVPKIIGNRKFAKGRQKVSDHFIYNVAFKALIKSGAVQVHPRDAVAQKIQMSNDMKAQQKAREARFAKTLKSAQAASGTSPTSPSAVGPVQVHPQISKPIPAGAKAPASARGRSK